jgi:hypothetical protein
MIRNDENENLSNDVEMNDNEPLSPQSLKNKLLNEGKDYYELAKEYRRNRYMKEAEEVTKLLRPLSLIENGLKNGKSM